MPLTCPSHCYGDETSCLAATATSLFLTTLCSAGLLASCYALEAVLGALVSPPFFTQSWAFVPLVASQPVLALNFHLSAGSLFTRITWSTAGCLSLSHFFLIQGQVTALPCLAILLGSLAHTSPWGTCPVGYSLLQPCLALLSSLQLGLTASPGLSPGALPQLGRTNSPTLLLVLVQLPGCGLGLPQLPCLA